MTTFKLTMTYDGSCYYGFQRQKEADRPTVQGILEEALSFILNEPVTIHGAGRTDAGVHARAQVAHFHTDRSISAASLVYALNRALPDSLVVTDACLVDDHFHARKCAIGKWYSYRIYNGAFPPAIGHQYFAHVPQPIDEALLRQALTEFCGPHCFKGFCGRGSSVQSYDRTLYLAHLLISEDRRWWQIHFVGDGFLRKMVRNLVGTALDISLGRRPMTIIAEALVSGDRRKAGKTAAAQGLVMERVFYDAQDLNRTIERIRAMTLPQ
jgi:tRNA pseudouridine38-40 synthase